MSKPIVFASQIDLPINADHEKSPIRQCELISHTDSEQHIPNDGLPNQMLAMTAAGPRMMTLKVQCSGVDELRYSCDCRIVFDDMPPAPPADFKVRCLKNGVTELPDIGQLNYPVFRLNFTASTDFFRFIPENVYELDLPELEYNILDNVTAELWGTPIMVNGTMAFDLRSENMNIKTSDSLIVHSILKPGIYGYITIHFDS